jgi:hypothetical protein
MAHRYAGFGAAWTTRQQEVMQAAIEGGRKVFPTGPARTGKNVLLESIIAALGDKENWVDGVVAPTGAAVENVDDARSSGFLGVGIHSQREGRHHFCQPGGCRQTRVAGKRLPVLRTQTPRRFSCFASSSSTGSTALCAVP